MSTIQRTNVKESAAEVYQAVVRAHRAAKHHVDPVLAELVMIRASQINRCAFCIDMHVKDAREAGESERRIHLLSAWQEADGVYDEREGAALALTEAVTVLTDGFVPDEVYARAARHFDEAELAYLIALITTINALNRINVATRTPPDA
jgi:AhpD family alkylhydroperoxidase